MRKIIAVARKPVDPRLEGIRLGLEAAALAATEVSKELRGATDRDKMLGMYGANQVWHRICAITPSDVLKKGKS